MKKYNIRKKLLSENGGAAVLVVFTIFTFLIVGMGAFMSVSTLRKSQLNSDLRIQQIYGEDYEKVDGVYEELLTKYAKYDEPYIPEGFTHIGTADWNSGYQIKETATGNIFVWVPCVLDQTKVKDGDKVETFKRTLPTTTDTTDPYYMYSNNLTIIGDVSPADEIETSVGKYGGFYIAAYEAGVPLAEDGTEIAPISATTSQKVRSVAGATTWTNITRINAITAATNMIDETSGVKSGLISGKCWDTTLQWMVNSSANKTANAGYDTDSTGNGWYKDVSNNDKTTTGQYPINNIYDMAGNVWEWTTENCTGDSSFLAFRGGCYNNSGSDYPAAYCGVGIDNAKDVGIAFRVVLYK